MFSENPGEEGGIIPTWRISKGFLEEVVELGPERLMVLSTQKWGWCSGEPCSRQMGPLSGKETWGFHSI